MSDGTHGRCPTAPAPTPAQHQAGKRGQAAGAHPAVEPAQHVDGVEEERSAGAAALGSRACAHARFISTVGLDRLFCGRHALDEVGDHRLGLLAQVGHHLRRRDHHLHAAVAELLAAVDVGLSDDAQKSGSSFWRGRP
jgi:hypothetical protein